LIKSKINVLKVFLYDIPINFIILFLYEIPIIFKILFIYEITMSFIILFLYELPIHFKILFLYEITMNFLSQSGEKSNPLLRSISPCLKNSSIHLAVHWWCKSHLNILICIGHTSFTWLLFTYVFRIRFFRLSNNDDIKCKKILQ